MTPPRTTKLSGAVGVSSFPGSSAVQPVKSTPLKSIVFVVGVMLPSALGTMLPPPACPRPPPRPELAVPPEPPLLTDEPPEAGLPPLFPGAPPVFGRPPAGLAGLLMPPVPPPDLGGMAALSDVIAGLAAARGSPEEQPNAANVKSIRGRLRCERSIAKATPLRWIARMCPSAALLIHTIGHDWECRRRFRRRPMSLQVVALRTKSVWHRFGGICHILRCDAGF